MRIGGSVTHPEPVDRLENGERTACTCAVRKPYLPPRLVRHGDVRDVTLGGSPGTGESGFPLAFFPITP